MLLLTLVILTYVANWINAHALGGIWAEARQLGKPLSLLAWCSTLNSWFGLSVVAYSVLGSAAHQMEFMSIEPSTAQAAEGYLQVSLVLSAVLTALTYLWIARSRDTTLRTTSYLRYKTICYFYEVYAKAPTPLGALDNFFDAVDAERPTNKRGATVLVLGFLLGFGIWQTNAWVRHFIGRLPLPKNTSPVNEVW